MTIETLFCRQTFAPLMGDPFVIQNPSQQVSTRLAQVDGLPGGGGDGQFSLLFEASPEQPLQQGSYPFVHPTLGAFELFITPVQCPHRDRRWYEAVINRPA